MSELFVWLSVVLLTSATVFEAVAHAALISSMFGIPMNYIQRQRSRIWHGCFAAMWVCAWVVIAMVNPWLSMFSVGLRMSLFPVVLNLLLGKPLMHIGSTAAIDNWLRENGLKRLWFVVGYLLIVTAIAMIIHTNPI